SGVLDVPTITAIAADDPAATATAGYINASGVTKAIKVSGTSDPIFKDRTVTVTWGGATGTAGAQVATATVGTDGKWVA
ncbi:hypothetical protein ABTK80_21695, partial [Acinetobacter baumannii]